MLSLQKDNLPLIRYPLTAFGIETKTVHTFPKRLLVPYTLSSFLPDLALLSGACILYRSLLSTNAAALLPSVCVRCSCARICVPLFPFLRPSADKSGKVSQRPAAAAEKHAQRKREGPGGRLGNPCVPPQLKGQGGRLGDHVVRHACFHEQTFSSRLHSLVTPTSNSTAS